MLTEQQLDILALVDNLVRCFIVRFFVKNDNHRAIGLLQPSLTANFDVFGFFHELQKDAFLSCRQMGLVHILVQSFHVDVGLDS